MRRRHRSCAPKVVPGMTATLYSSINRCVSCIGPLSLGRVGGILFYMKDEARQKQAFDVLLSHNSQDEAASRVTDKRRGL